MNPRSAVNQSVVRTAPRRVYGAEAKQRIARELHGIVITTDPAQCRWPLWWQDLRRKRLQAWGAMLRLIDVLVMAGAPRETVLSIPALLHAYAQDQLDARDGVAHEGQPPRAA